MQPIHYADTDTLSLRQLDELNHAPKGTAFRVFRRCEAQLEEGKDFFYLAADVHKALIDSLKVSGQIYATTVNLVLLTQSGIGELRLGTSGGSSTMPQKQNPVAPSVLIALARQAVALNGALLSAGAPRQERDGGAWFTEWLSLPQLCLCAASAVETARGLRVEPVPGAMAEALELNGGVIHAEALSFLLAEHMGRPEAQAAVKEICKRVAKEGRPLAALAGETWPEVELGGVFDARQQLGEAPGEAREFARAVRAL